MNAYKLLLPSENHKYSKYYNDHNDVIQSYYGCGPLIYYKLITIMIKHLFKHIIISILHIAYIEEKVENFSLPCLGFVLYYCSKLTKFA